VKALASCKEILQKVARSRHIFIVNYLNWVVKDAFTTNCCSETLLTVINFKNGWWKRVKI
jgi:hypothetical protein